MNYKSLKDCLLDAISSTASRISSLCSCPDRDFTRNRLLPAGTLMRFLISMGSLDLTDDLTDFFGIGAHIPSASALCQQRAKLDPEALRDVLIGFTSAAAPGPSASGYRFFAIDGSALSFKIDRRHPERIADYIVDCGHSAKGFCSIHINALFDLDDSLYRDAVLQPVRTKDEFGAFCQLVDRFDMPGPGNAIFIADRGYPSYNTMAHVIEAGHFFLFRVKDINSKGMLRAFGLSDTSFDTRRTLTIVRRSSKKLTASFPKGQCRFVGKDIAFDFADYGSDQSYSMDLRIVRFPLDDANSVYECLVTNLPEEDFPLSAMKELYFRRWSIESSFRDLKYTIGLRNLHSLNPVLVQQEIYARLVMYNFITACSKLAEVKHRRKTAHVYKVDFSSAAKACKDYLRLASSFAEPVLLNTLSRFLVPVRPGRQYERLKTAHFRPPRHLTYRPS